MTRKTYDYEDRLKTRLENEIIESKELSESNKEILSDFFKLLKSEGLSHIRRYKYLCQILAINNMLDKEFDKVEREDLIKLAGDIKDQDKSRRTIEDYLITVKKFYKTITQLNKYEEKLNNIYIWLYDGRNKFFKLASKKKNNDEKEKWFTEEDVIKIIEATEKIKYKAFFSIMATQGTRPQELLTLRKRDVEDIENGVKIQVNGKTGVRPLYIYEPKVIIYLKEHIDSLPDNKDYVFDFSNSYGNRLLKILCHKASIDKKAYLYKLRKFSVTQDRIQGLSTGAMEQKYGWVKGSKMLSFYDKSISKDYKEEIQKKHGIITETKNGSKLKEKLQMPYYEEKNQEMEELKERMADMEKVLRNYYKKEVGQEV